MSTNRFLQMATAGADVTVPEEINSCCFFSCQVSQPRSGNVVAIPGTCDFAVAIKSGSNGDTRVDHWTQDPTTGNLTRNNNQGCLYCGGTFGESIHNAGGLSSAPYFGVDLVYQYDNCGYRVQGWCVCGSCLCASSDALGEAINDCCSCFEGPNGINQLCCDGFGDFILFHGGTGCIFAHAHDRVGAANYTPKGGEGGRKVVATNWCKNTNKAVGLHYDHNTCKFHLTFTPSGSNNWGHWTIQHCDGSGNFTCCCNYFGNRGVCYEGRSLKGGYDAKRCVNVWASSHCMLDDQSNGAIGLRLIEAPSCTGTATGLGTVSEACYVGVDLCNNSSGNTAMLQGFIEQFCGAAACGGSHNLILSHSFYNNSYEFAKVNQIVYGSGGYQETLCLFHTQSYTRPICGQNGAYHPDTGWTVMAFSAYCCNCYFLRAFKGRCVS